MITLQLNIQSGFFNAGHPNQLNKQKNWGKGWETLYLTAETQHSKNALNRAEITELGITFLHYGKGRRNRGNQHTLYK